MKKWPVFLTVFIIFIAVILIGSNCWIKVNEITLYYTNLPDDFSGIKIAHVSDTHVGNPGYRQQSLIAILEKQSPDIIVFTGDLLDGSSNLEKKLGQELLENMADIAPVYFVKGNHDYWLEDGAEFFAGLEDENIIILNNESAAITRNDSVIQLAGVEDPFTCRHNFTAALKGIRKNDFCILLVHTPDDFEQTAAQGVDLVFSGHHHGGQVRIPFLGAIYAPGGQFFPHYDSGLYKTGTSNMYLSRGLGHTGIVPFRFWNRPELAFIYLYNSSPSS